MNNFRLEKYRHVHFIGIGGVSMNSLAIYCKDAGMEVSGSDITKNDYTKKCRAKGIKVFYKHKRNNINGADLVVYNGAINQDNVEYLEAINRQIDYVDRAELLGYICKNFKYVIGVSGTHGKSTTCAMIYHILREAGEKVSCHIGADILESRLNPFDKYLVLESCEYNKSFLRFNCNLAVILNVENDHLDCYENMYNLRNAFSTFLKRAKDKFVMENNSTSYIKGRLINWVKPAEILSPNSFVVDDKKYTLNNTYGEHNINNATMAIAVCSFLGISESKIAKALKSFVPAKRRCQTIGKIFNIEAITDYAHHPTEIKCLYDSLKQKYSNIYMIFQPHTYSRTKLLLEDFIKVLNAVDNLVLFKEYPAREHKSAGLSAKQLSGTLPNSVYAKNVGALKKYLTTSQFEKTKSCIVFVGAGDINEVAEKLVKNLGEKL